MYNFDEYEKSCKEIWIWRLNDSYKKIISTVEKHTGKRLVFPMFEINANNNSKWGSWNPQKRILSLSANLLRNFEWEAVEHVLKHEIAHQIVSEIFEMDCHGVAHGEAWKNACKIVDIVPNRCDSADFLSSFKGWANNTTEASCVANKVRKLLIHAHNEASTECESGLFMTKAKELMDKHNLDMEQITGNKKLWISRPFGPLFSRFPTYMWSIGKLLDEHYNVKSIKTYGPVKNYKHTSRLELFGEPANLDIAEYVGHVLLSQSLLLYEKHKKSRSKEKFSYNKLSKNAFIEGVIIGYLKKLDEQKSNSLKEEKTHFKKNIVPMYNKKLLNEMFNNNYKIRYANSGSYYRGYGLREGQIAGNNLIISKGISKDKNKMLLLN